MTRSIAAVGLLCLLGIIVGSPDALAQTGPSGPGMPRAEVSAPFPPLSAAHQKFLDDVLTYWEQRSQTVERYRCTFERWEYDPVFGPRDTFKTYSKGAIKYSAPDKGLFKVEKIMHYTPPAAAGEKPKFVEREGESGEHWICDGQSIFEHDHKNKHLIQRELPPHMRGKAIADGPLPFLFGAEAEKIKQRYWVRPLPVPDGVKEYWLEAFPKTRKDAASYLKVHVIIDQADFLPKGLVIFDRNFNPRENPARTTFTFSEREVNWSVAFQTLKFWEREFFEPSTKPGWKKVVEKYNAPPDAQAYAPAGVDDATQARRPTPGEPTR